ncbi:MAG: hypothetical protein ACOYB2_10885 [Limnohabitans sp.]
MAATAAVLSTEAVLSQSTFKFDSRTNGAGHEVHVKVAKDGSMYLTCSCPGGRFAFASKTHPGRGCWAMQSVRKALGMAAV